MAELKERYEKEIRPALKEKLGKKTIMGVPKLEKIVVNMGVGRAVSDKRHLDNATDELILITGQHAVKTKARKSISNFKVREGYEIGCKVTLRRERMYDFLERLVKIALPRVRDFQGVSLRAFDGQGNYNLGIKEHIIFPEIKYDQIDSVKGLNVTFVTNAQTDDDARELLRELGLPFRKR